MSETTIFIFPNQKWCMTFLVTKRDNTDQLKDYNFKKMKNMKYDTNQIM